MRPSDKRSDTGWTRRRLIAAGLQGSAYLALGRALAACGGSGGSGGNGGGPGPVDPGTPGGVPAGRFGDIPPLGEPLDIGIRIPRGFSARVIGKAWEKVPGTNLTWHTDPDGAAVFPADDGGWIYVSNKEFIPGGVNALRFNAAGEVVDGYNILHGLLSSINCGGGITPWGTWLSCEETDVGRVWECDPLGKTGPRLRSALGTFKHEAVAVDPSTNIFYLTEDQSDGRFYRFVPDQPNVGGVPDYGSGKFQAMRVSLPQDELNQPGVLDPVAVDWLDVPNPNLIPTRTRVAETTAFRGGEGIWYHDGVVYFSTKGDRRVWAHRPADSTVEIIYDDDLFAEPILDSVDNIVVTPGGDLIIVEDKSEANQQAVALTRDERIFPIIELVGQEGSEVTGPAFSPDGRHFYFSSQRGPVANGATGFNGITYCVTGDWFTPL